jgi:hypothetical protein
MPAASPTKSSLMTSQSSNPNQNLSQSQKMSRRINERAPLTSKPISRPISESKPRRRPPPPPPQQQQQQQPEVHTKPEKPPARLSNLFGLIDPQKLQSIFGGPGNGSSDLPYNPRYARQPQLETIPEVSDSRRGSGEGEGVGLQGIVMVFTNIISLM